MDCKPTPDEFQSMERIVHWLARRYLNLIRDVDYDDLVQEGWIYALVALDYYRRLPKERQTNFGGCIRNWSSLKMSMYCRHATCPVSFPKTKVPPVIRKGYKCVEFREDVIVSPSELDHIALENIRRRFSPADEVIFGNRPVGDVAESHSMDEDDVRFLVSECKKHLQELGK